MRMLCLLQLTTGQGKGRAFIRECLTEQLLADCIQNSVSNKKRTKFVIFPPLPSLVTFDLRSIIPGSGIILVPSCSQSHSLREC